MSSGLPVVPLIAAVAAIAFVTGAAGVGPVGAAMAVAPRSGVPRVVPPARNDPDLGDLHVVDLGLFGNKRRNAVKVERHERFHTVRVVRTTARTT